MAFTMQDRQAVTKAMSGQYRPGQSHLNVLSDVAFVMAGVN